jgi:hypothetical protein
MSIEVFYPTRKKIIAMSAKESERVKCQVREKAEQTYREFVTWFRNIRKIQINQNVWM